MFDEDSDGMFARVEAPSANLLRIWVCVKACRLFEGLLRNTTEGLRDTTAVEALGLDPTKGVMVSQLYFSFFLAFLGFFVFSFFSEREVVFRGQSALCSFLFR